jgi:hypothetical protein
VSPRTALIAVALLGAFHGFNPGMGWLFAVARGMQEGDRREVLRSLGPIALGHELSIAIVVALVVGLEATVSAVTLRILGALVLLGFGIYKFVKPLRHPRTEEMRVSRHELGVWSFLMSSAHGAGLMLFPVIAGTAVVARAGEAQNLVQAGSFGGGSFGFAALLVTVHVAAMLAVMGVVSMAVYQKVGVGMLRRAWVNLDLVWACALVAAGLFTLFTA